MRRAKTGSRGPRSEPLECGSKVRDVREDRDGVILDYACQYSHPKAAPNYSYLIRWDDGQVQAVFEAAINSSHGLETVE